MSTGHQRSLKSFYVNNFDVSTVGMSRAHICMTRTDLYSSQQTVTQTVPVTQPVPVTPPKFWPVSGPAHKNGSVYFAFYVHKVADHLQSLDEDMWHGKYLFHQHLLPIFATVRTEFS